MVESNEQQWPRSASGAYQRQPLIRFFEPVRDYAPPANNCLAQVSSGAFKAG